MGDTEVNILIRCQRGCMIMVKKSVAEVSPKIQKWLKTSGKCSIFIMPMKKSDIINIFEVLTIIRDNKSKPKMEIDKLIIDNVSKLKREQVMAISRGADYLKLPLLKILLIEEIVRRDKEKQKRALERKRHMHY